MVELDDRVADDAEETQEPLLHDAQQLELIRAALLERIEQSWLHRSESQRLAGFRLERTQHQQLQEYLEIHDALELKRRMADEFNEQYRLEQGLETNPIFIEAPYSTE